MKKNTGSGYGSVQTWKKNSIEDHRLQDRLRDLAMERNSCIQHLCDRQKEVRLDAASQGRHRLPQQRSLDSEVILSDTSSVNFESQRKFSLQLDKQVLNSVRSADARSNDTNELLPPLSSSLPSSCHHRRFSLHHEPTGTGTWVGPPLAEHGVARDDVKVAVAPRSRRGSLDGNWTSGLTFLAPPGRRQSLQTAGLVRQRSTDTSSQSASPSTPDSKTREGSHFVFPPSASTSTSSQLRQSQTAHTTQFSRDFSETNFSIPLSFSSQAPGSHHFSRHTRNYPAKSVLPQTMAAHRRSEGVGNKMAVMHHVMQNSAIFAMTGLEDEECVSDK